MKHIFRLSNVLFAVTMLLASNIKAQCLNDASTNPNNPINNEMKDVNGTVEASYSTMKEQFGPNFEQRKIQ